jgi:hypothetical protein
MQLDLFPNPQLQIPWPVCQRCKGTGLYCVFKRDQYGPAAFHQTVCQCRFAQPIEQHGDGDPRDNASEGELDA